MFYTLVYMWWIVEWTVELICCITIIGIPFGKQFSKLLNCLCTEVQ